MYNLFDHYLKGEYAYTQTMMPVCERHGLTYTELAVMMFLANNPDMDTASDIVRCRRLAKSHVSVSVRSLEEKGLILREYKGTNRRSVHLRLTEKAEPIVADGRDAQSAFVEAMFKGTSDEERTVLTKILRRIDENIEACSAGKKKEAFV